MTRPSVLTRFAATVAAVSIAIGLAPAASAVPAFTGMPAGSVELPPIEQMPIWTPVIPGLSIPPVLTIPILGVDRPVAEYGNVDIFPTQGELVGVAQPIMFNFDRPITDRARAERTLSVRSAPAVSGFFYWINDHEVRWRPHKFWPTNTSIVASGAGRQHTFRTGDALIATYDDASHSVTVTRNGTVVRTMPASAGRPGYETYPGVFYTGQRGRKVFMDSTTYGLALDAGGYAAVVDDAVRLSYDGIYIHSAPWSVADQGVRNVSHGCINLSPDDAAWYYQNTRNGDPVIVKGTAGRLFGPFDGQGDWGR